MVEIVNQEGVDRRTVLKIAGSAGASRIAGFPAVAAADDSNEDGNGSPMTTDSVRIWRSPYASLVSRDPDKAVEGGEGYTEEYFQELADHGLNSIWIDGALNEIAQTDVFPELGKDANEHQEHLQAIIERADDAGIGVWLYSQPPESLPPDHEFWDDHPELRGITGGPGAYDVNQTFCTSRSATQEFIQEGAKNLSQGLPGLEGIFLITASESMQHCYSHVGTRSGAATNCEQGLCQSREPKDIIVDDIINNVRNGLAEAGNGARLIAWNWSWSHYYDEPQAEIIQELPEDIILMAGFERGDTKEILGEERPINEYSLSFAGPSERAKGSIEEARERGLVTMSKLQHSTTHELATVPNLPVIGTIYEKADGLRQLNVDNYLGCWDFGNMLCSNTAALNYFLEADPLPPRQDALTEFAESYFVKCRSSKVVEAWELFANAMDFYPFTIPFLYFGPLNYAVAHPIKPEPLDPEPVGRSWQPEDHRGDELEEAFGPYTLEEMQKGLGELTRIWMDGVKSLEEGLLVPPLGKPPWVNEATGASSVDPSHSPLGGSSEQPSPPSDHERSYEELASATVAGHSFHSGWNLYRAYELRKDYSPSDRDAILEIMRDERDHLSEALPAIEVDDRVGFHSEAQVYMYNADSVRQKLEYLNKELD